MPMKCTSPQFCQVVQVRDKLKFRIVTVADNFDRARMKERKVQDPRKKRKTWQHKDLNKNRSVSWFFYLLQRRDLIFVRGLVKFLPALALLFSLALPGSCLTRSAKIKSHLCICPHLVMMLPDERPLIGGGVIEPICHLHLGLGRRRRRGRSLRHFQCTSLSPCCIFICESEIFNQTLCHFRFPYCYFKSCFICHMWANLVDLW